MSGLVLLIAICIGVNVGCAVVNFMNDNPALGVFCLSMAAFSFFALTLVL